MLEYFYTNSIERTLFEKNTRDILIIADRYNVGRLKEECERHIAESMTIKTFCSLVTFADMYSCDVLMTVRIFPRFRMRAHICAFRNAAIFSSAITTRFRVHAIGPT